MNSSELSFYHEITSIVKNTENKLNFIAVLLVETNFEITKIL